MCFSFWFLALRPQSGFHFAYVNHSLIRPFLHLDSFLDIPFGKNSFKWYVNGTLA